MKDQAKLLTDEEVAEMLGVSAAWVRDHATRRTPRIRCVRVGGEKRAKIRFRLEDVEEFIAQNLTEPEDEPEGVAS